MIMPLAYSVWRMAYGLWLMASAYTPNRLPNRRKTNSILLNIATKNLICVM